MERWKNESKKVGLWKEELEKVEQCSQRQDGTLQQMQDLHTIAVRFGLYDAADLIFDMVAKKQQPIRRNPSESVKMKSYVEIEDEIKAAKSTVQNYQEAYANGEIDRTTLRKSVTENQTTIATLRWVLGENDRFD